MPALINIITIYDATRGYTCKARVSDKRRAYMLMIRSPVMARKFKYKSRFPGPLVTNMGGMVGYTRAAYRLRELCLRIAPRSARRSTQTALRDA